MRLPRAVILGCAGPVLGEDERRFFAEADPLGFILFQRNCVDPGQVRRLVDEMRASVGRSDAPVLIDQEGGRVARLGPPHWRRYPAAARIAALGRDEAAEAAWSAARLIADDLAALGITVDCAPVLDVPVPGAHEIIGDRALGRDADTVARLGRAVCDGLLAGGVLPVLKHIPGHGRGNVDSHLALPVVEAAWNELERSDFAPFRQLSAMPWAMTAHVVYTAVDAARPATVSPVVIGEVIRRVIGFDGVLVSDDLSMQALGGGLADRAAAALEAGCDLVLHCNGRFDEMVDVVAGTRRLSQRALERLARGEAMRAAAAPVDRIALAQRFDSLLGAA